jgi:oligopeptide/dipeptide ABC transporter ATP-binding protein
MVFQEPMTALDPLFTVGSQVAETIAAHERVGRKDARERALDLLNQVGISSPRERLDAYPHQLSGGMRQRIVIAIGIALRPKVLIADEPTTALDVTVQAQIMDLLAQMQKRLGMGLILITHDLGLVSENADRVAVMYGGKIVESATTSALFSKPTHPYTQGLIRAKAGGTDQRGRLHVISGLPPTLTSPVRSCPFAPRCDRAVASCIEQMPPITPRGDDASHHFACWNPLQ